jgi:DNA-binding transcriptional LysR family regulator
MELHQVRYFLTLAQTLNFTRAAEACNVTQPALTRAIQRLEDELGGPLLYRERTLTQLTDLGRTVLPLLEQTYAAALAAKEQAAAFKRRDAAPLRLGLTASVSALFLAPVLAELQARLTGFELTLWNGATDALIERLLASELDAGIVVAPEKLSERLNRWPLFTEPYVVVCGRGHRLANLDAVPIDALRDECVLSRADPGCDFARALTRLADKAGMTPTVRHTGSRDGDIWAMVASAMGVALSAAHQPLPAELIAKKLADPDAVRIVLCCSSPWRAACTARP